jgi:hypothetical protein
MGRLNPDKLHVTYLQGLRPTELDLPRRYTLTHSDVTGDLFLSIGREYDTHRISRPWTRLMRDEVLAELAGVPDALRFHVFCHVSGGLVVGAAGWRYAIFQSELPLALEAIRHGDQSLFVRHPELDLATVLVNFKSSKSRFNTVQRWGILGDYAHRP